MGLGILITADNKANQELTGLVSFVEVYHKIDLAISYKIRFAIDVCSNDVGTLWEKVTNPGSLLGVLVEVNDQLHCLVSGPVTNHQINLEHGGSGSWLEVVGTDQSIELDAKQQAHSQSGKDSDLVNGILNARYKPNVDVESTPSSSHEEEKHTQVQLETDLAFIRRLAQRNGFHFWFTYDRDGKPRPHFRSRSLDGEPKANLVVNLDNANVDNLQIKWDIKPPVKSEGKQVDQNSKEIFGGETTLKKSESLGTEGLPKIVGNLGSTMRLAPPVDDAGTLSARAQAALRDAQWFINGSCKTTMNRICKIIECHTLVNVDGAGSRYGGKYYVVGVKHNIDSAVHSMEIELSRNAWNSKENILSDIKAMF